MLSNVSDPASDRSAESWRPFFPLVLDGLAADRAGPLPGSALSLDELDAMMEATAATRRS